jgi:hypothetical protein
MQVSLTQRLKAWQFGFSNLEKIDSQFVLDALYPKKDLIHLLHEAPIHSIKNLAEAILRSLKPLEVGLFL